MITVLLSSLFTFPSTALNTSSDFSTSTDNTTSAETECRNIVTRHKDGSISYRSFAYTRTSSTRNLSELVKEPYIPTAQLNLMNNSRASTVNSDGRSQVLPADPRVINLRALYDTDGDGEIDYRPLKGTACLQSYDVAISAGHCVWSPSLGWPVAIECYLGRTYEVTYTAMVTSSNFSIGQDFVDNSYWVYENSKKVDYYDFDHDWSIIILDENVGGTYGWFGLHGCGTAESGLAIEVYGHPGDKYRGHQQWKSTGTLGSINSNIIRHNAYSYSGMSGGPIVNNGYVYGIHTHCYLDSHHNCGGTRMNDWLFELIVSECEISEEIWG